MWRLDIRDMQAGESSGKLTGFATMFGVVNPWYSEIIEENAFDKTLKESGGRVPVESDHREWIGMTTGAEATKSGRKKGILFDAELNFEVAAARERWALARQAFALGSPAGLSQTFVAVKDRIQDGIRYVSELRWLGVSITAPGYQSLDPARVTQMRSNIARWTEQGLWTPDTDALAREALDGLDAQAAQQQPQAEPRIALLCNELDGLLTAIRGT